MSSRKRRRHLSARARRWRAAAIAAVVVGIATGGYLGVRADETT
jgi:hypothetical protein